MKRTFHIIGKDFRDLRLLFPLVGWWSIAILQLLLIAVFPRLPISPPAIEMTLGFFLVGLAWLLAALDFGLLVLIVSQLVQRDSTVGSTAFWLSRPVSGANLLAGKALFLLLAVILPTLVVTVPDAPFQRSDPLRRLSLGSADCRASVAGPFRAHDAGVLDHQPAPHVVPGNYRGHRIGNRAVHTPLVPRPKSLGPLGQIP